MADTTIIPVPTLSASGWVRSTAEKADTLMAHFYESLKSQTQLFGSNVANLQYVIEQYAHDVVSLCQQLRATLQAYLENYYSAVTVDVTSDALTQPELSKIPLRVHITVTEKDGIRYSFGRLLVVSGTKLERIARINELGEVQALAQ